MLPDVETDERGAAAATGRFTHDGAVLIRGAGHGESAVGLDDEPGPAGAEAGQGSIFESLLEGVEGAEGAVDRGGEIAGGGSARVGAENAPEKGMVGVTAAVVADRVADALRHGAEVGDQLVNGLAFEIGIALERLVEVGDVGSVVFAMMDFHRLRVDVGFESVQCVGEGGEFVCHGS